MNISQMTASIDRLSTLSEMPELPLFDKAEEGGAHIVASLVVSLADALTRARRMNAASLEVYCDTLTVEGIVRTDKHPRRVSIVCRRLVAEGAAKFVLSHFEEDDHTAARMICERIEGDFELISNSPAGKHVYDLSPASTPRAVPEFANFVFLEGEPKTAVNSFPIGLLADGQPLHRLLEADFSLAAGVLAMGDDAAINRNFAYEVLTWLSNWSGVQDDIAEIARHAERLRALVPLDVDGTLTTPIPERTAKDYIGLIEARKDYARTIRVDEMLVEQSGDMADIAKQFAQATSKRDLVEVNYIKQETEALMAREPKLKAALATSAQSVADFKFQQKLDRIDLDLAIELDRIDKIVKASFDIAIGVISLGASIAAICLGVPADPGAAAKKDIDGVKGLIDTFKENWQGSSKNPFDFFRHLDNLMFLYKVPFTFVWKNKSAMQDSFTALAKSGLSIKSAFSTINSSGGMHDNLAIMVTTLNDAMRDLANKPGVIEARAAWDAMELETVNQLDRVINDSEVAAGIKDAATKYKSTVQKMAIYGRAMAEHQAMIDANQREIASRLLQRCAQLAKESEAQKLVHLMHDRAELNAHIKADLDNRLNTAARSFYVACYGYRRAQFYETYSLPATPITLSLSTKDMAETYSGLRTDLSDAETLFNRRKAQFTDSVYLDDPEDIARLMNGEAVTWSIGTDTVARQSFVRLRLTRAEVRLEMKGVPTGTIGFDLLSPGSFTDRVIDGTAKFSGPIVSIPFDYDADGIKTQKDFPDVHPTPFSDWMVTLREGSGAQDVTGVKLHVEGWAFQ